VSVRGPTFPDQDSQIETVKRHIRNTLRQHYYAQTKDQEKAATEAFHTDTTLASISPDRPIVWHESCMTLDAALKAESIYTSLGTPVRVLAVNADPPTTAGGSQYSQTSGITGLTERLSERATGIKGSLMSLCDDQQSDRSKQVGSELGRIRK
jgi:hypothetical protein